MYIGLDILLYWKFCIYIVVMDIFHVPRNLPTLSFWYREEGVV